MIRSTERVRRSEFLTVKRRAKYGVLQLHDEAEVAGGDWNNEVTGRSFPRVRSEHERCVGDYVN